MLSTCGSLPVAHDFAGTASNRAPVPSPVSPEWPIATMPTGWVGSAARDATVALVGSVGADEVGPDEVGADEHPMSTTTETATQAPALGDAPFMWRSVGICGGLGPRLGNGAACGHGWRLASRLANSRDRRPGLQDPRQPAHEVPETRSDRSRIGPSWWPLNVYADPMAARARHVVATGFLFVMLAVVSACGAGSPGGGRTTTVAPTSGSPVPTVSASPNAQDTDGGSRFPPVIDGPTVTKTEFNSPSGNISCSLSKASANCFIGDIRYPLPPRPADCGEDWQPRFGVGRTGAAEFGACAGDVLVFTSDVLPYDTTSVIGSFACMSRTVGIACWNTRTRHGFQISRARYALH